MEGAATVLVGWTMVVVVWLVTVMIAGSSPSRGVFTMVAERDGLDDAASKGATSFVVVPVADGVCSEVEEGVAVVEMVTGATDDDETASDSTTIEVVEGMDALADAVSVDGVAAATGSTVERVVGVKVVDAEGGRIAVDVDGDGAADATAAAATLAPAPSPAFAPSFASTPAPTPAFAPNPTLAPKSASTSASTPSPSPSPSCASAAIIKSNQQLYL